MRRFLDEDWLPVILGGLLIGVVLVGMRFPALMTKWTAVQDLGTLFSRNALFSLAAHGVVCLVVSILGVALTGGKLGRFAVGFPIVFVAAWVSQIIAGNANVSWLGFEYVIFALVIGLLIGNLSGGPAWLLEAARSEHYIKTGLVLLGAGTLFPDIMQAGLLGIAQALLVVTVIWFACYGISRLLKVDKELAVMLCSSVSICGVSAAIAACGAIKGDKKKLSYVISLTLIVALPMMLLMPWIARRLGLTESVAGAWMGGTLDTTGSVVAATSLVGEVATKIGTIVKLSQNVLIGIAALAISVWWALSRKGGEQAKGNPKVIWERFPKFVLGFIAASLIFSFVLPGGIVKETKGLLGSLRTTWFALAFVSIGMETRFSALFERGRGRPAATFILAQLVNIVWTLALAFLLFGGSIFPVPGAGR